MIRLRDTRHENTAGFLGSAIKVAEYYGFVPLEEALRTRTPQPRVAPQKLEEIAFARREERALAQIARRSAASVQGTQPANFFWRVATGQSTVPSLSLELHIVGVQSAIAEAMLLVVAQAITEDAGLARPTLSINNMGSLDSSSRYVRDVATYLRKHIDSISPTLRPRAATDPLGTLVQLIERGHPGVARAPQAMEYLTEEERRRFWELLEYLEAAGLSYELNGAVLGSTDCWSHTLFELSSIDQESNTRLPLAFGGRYDRLASRFGRPTSAATIAITCEVRGKTRFKRDVPGMPAIYFAHLGLEARRMSLGILENLRKAEIPVYHNLHMERLAEQMIRAKELATPYILIVGYKEASEKTALVREVATNSQEAIPLTELPGYLKRRRVGTRI